MNGTTASKLRRYVRKHVPEKYQPATVKAIMVWWSALGTRARRDAARAMAADKLPVSPSMAADIRVPGAPPPKQRRKRGVRVQDMTAAQLHAAAADGLAEAQAGA